MPHLWEVFILKNVVLLDQIKVLPLLAGTSWNYPVYSGNDEETFQTDTASPAWREPDRMPDAKLRDSMPITPFHGQLWWFPVGTIRGFPERSGRGMVRHDTPASIMRFRILSTYGSGLFWNPCGAKRIYNAVTGLLILCYSGTRRTG